MNRFTQIIAVNVILMQSLFSPSQAQDTCFWDLSGVKKLLNGIDADVRVIDSSLCRTLPDFFINEVNSSYNWELNSVLLAATKDTVFISVSTRDCPTCVGCKCIIRFSKLFPLDLPRSNQVSEKTAALVTSHIQYAPNNGHDTISLIVAANTGLMELSFADIRFCSSNLENPDFTINKVQHLSLTEKVTGQEILGISSMNDTGSIVVFGTKGLLRVIEYAAMTERVNDVDPGENLVCSGDEYVGSEDGTIYFTGDQQPVAETGEHLRFISAGGASSENGKIMEHRGDNWDVYSAGSLSVRSCSFINTSRGREALIIDDQFHLHQLFLYDTPSKFTVDTLCGLAPHINAASFVYNGRDTLPVKFTVTDPEGNIKWPKVELRTKDTSFQIGCSQTLYGNTFEMSFSGDSIKKIETTQKFICPYPPDCEIYRGSICTTTVFWRISDTVVITSENEELRIINGTSISVDRSMGKSIRKYDLQNIADKIIACVRQGRIFAGTGNRFNYQIYNVQGKATARNVLNSVLPPGIYVLQVESENRNLSRRFSIMRRGNK